MTETPREKPDQHTLTPRQSAGGLLRIVITGGPGAGKTALIEVLRRNVCSHVALVPESATIVFGGGFPRLRDDHGRRAAQRAIFHVQRELESLYDPVCPRVMLCDRGTIDGLAYWPGAEEDFCRSVGILREDEMLRYDAVIHLRPPPAHGGYQNGNNPLRIETAAEALAVDERIAHAWRGHPHRSFIESTSDFLLKVRRALRVIRGLLPVECRAAVRSPRSCGRRGATAPLEL